MYVILRSTKSYSAEQSVSALTWSIEHLRSVMQKIAQTGSNCNLKTIKLSIRRQSGLPVTYDSKILSSTVATA